MSETVVPLIDNTEEKCPNCCHHVVSRYKLSSEPDEAATCGDCFGEWLARIDATIHTE